MIVSPLEAKLQVTHDKVRGVVLLEFVKPVNGVNMSATTARAIAASLMRHADEIDSQVVRTA
jgi:post-segregation antitoxin (ccd killing protein)